MNEADLVVGGATNGNIGMVTIYGSAWRFKVDGQTGRLTTVLNNCNLRTEIAREKNK